eukprot:SAG31_NODE_3295_length_4448_cov_3.127616_3_plen_106_part_00
MRACDFSHMDSPIVVLPSVVLAHMKRATSRPAPWRYLLEVSISLARRKLDRGARAACMACRPAAGMAWHGARRAWPVGAGGGRLHTAVHVVRPYAVPVFGHMHGL